MATTTLLVIVGAFVILRTVRPDSEGLTLVDRVLGAKGTGAPGSPSATSELETPRVALSEDASKTIPVGKQHGLVRITNSGQLH